MPLDADRAQYYVNRGKRIALSDSMPEPLSTNPSWYECKFYPAHGVICFRESGVSHEKARRNDR